MNHRHESEASTADRKLYGTWCVNLKLKNINVENFQLKLNFKTFRNHLE